MNDQREIEATTVTLDQAAFTLTGFRTKFENDLRPGEVVTVSGTSAEGETSFRVERVDPQYIKTQSGNSHTGSTYNVFDYATQVARVDPTLNKGSISNGEYSVLARLRPYIFQKDYQNGE